jgi:2'-5' RNA ligase
MDESIRAFIAVELHPSIQSQLAAIIQQLKVSIPGKVKWTSEKNLHLTLKFLGEVHTWEISPLQQMMRNIANQSSSFSTKVDRLGAFPSNNNPRIIWAGLSEVGELVRLARALEEGSRKLGYDAEEKAFTPHLTLGRVRPEISRDEQNGLANCIRAISAPTVSPIEVSSIALFQSILKPGGAEYINLHESHFNH